MAPWISGKILDVCGAVVQGTYSRNVHCIVDRKVVLKVKWKEVYLVNADQLHLRSATKKVSLYVGPATPKNCVECSSKPTSCKGLCSYCSLYVKY